MIRNIVIAAGAFAIVGAGAAYANHHEGDKAAEHKADGHKNMVEAHFAEMDADKNNAVTEAEFLAFVTAQAKAKFASAAGDDGVLTLEEAKAHHEAKMQEMKNHHEQMMGDDGADKGDE